MFDCKLWGLLADRGRVERQNDSQNRSGDTFGSFSSGRGRELRRRGWAVCLLPLKSDSRTIRCCGVADAVVVTTLLSPSPVERRSFSLSSPLRLVRLIHSTPLILAVASFLSIPLVRAAMPDISRSYVETLPSVTRVLFLSSLGLCLLVSAAHLPFMSYLPASIVHPLQSVLHPFTFSLPASLSATVFSSSFYLHFHRLLTSFLVYPLLLPPTFVLSCLCFILLAVYSRAIEESYLYHASGAAQYTAALAFAVTFLLSFSLIPKPTLSSGSGGDHEQLSVRADAPSGLYFNLSLSLLMFVVTLYTSFDPYAPLSFTSLLLQWQSAYVLAAVLSVLAPPALPSLLLGVLCCYCYHFATSGAHRVWGRQLWGAPQWLVALYERWGVGTRKFGFNAHEGGRPLGDSEQEQ